jgi:hypothetical protein
VAKVGSARNFRLQIVDFRFPGLQITAKLRTGFAFLAAVLAKFAVTFGFLRLQKQKLLTAKIAKGARRSQRKASYQGYWTGEVFQSEIFNLKSEILRAQGQRKACL